MTKSSICKVVGGDGDDAAADANVTSRQLRQRVGVMESDQMLLRIVCLFQHLDLRGWKGHAEREKLW